MSIITPKSYSPQGSFKLDSSISRKLKFLSLVLPVNQSFLLATKPTERGLKRSAVNDFSISGIRQLRQPRGVDKPLVTRLDRLASNLADYKILRLEYPQTIEKAEKLIEQLSSGALENNWCWQNPLVNITFEHEIVLEWWNKSKKITIYVSEEAIDYIKVWGADMDDEMAEGSINLNDDLTDLSQWISS